MNQVFFPNNAVQKLMQLFFFAFDHKYTYRSNGGRNIIIKSPTRSLILRFEWQQPPWWDGFALAFTFILILSHTLQIKT